PAANAAHLNVSASVPVCFDEHARPSSGIDHPHAPVVWIQQALDVIAMNSKVEVIPKQHPSDLLRHRLIASGTLARQVQVVATRQSRVINPASHGVVFRSIDNSRHPSRMIVGESCTADARWGYCWCLL